MNLRGGQQSHTMEAQSQQAALVPKQNTHSCHLLLALVCHQPYEGRSLDPDRLPPLWNSSTCKDFSFRASQMGPSQWDRTLSHQGRPQGMEKRGLPLSQHHIQ